MPNILYMTISEDGFIAGTDDETPWSNDSWESFRQFVASCDKVLLGRRTYHIMKRDNEFVPGPEYIVVTSDKSTDTGSFQKLDITSASDMPKAAKVGIIGGGDLNGRLAKLGVIDEMFIDTEPVRLQSGTKLFGNHDIDLPLKLVDTKKLGQATVQRHYIVQKV